MNFRYLALGLALMGSPMARGQTDHGKQEREILFQEVEALKAQQNSNSTAGSKLRLGGYGEIHFNSIKDGASFSDIHRFVLFTNYAFADWIEFVAETELEHTFVSADNGGELKIEQFYTEFKLIDAANIRVGRILAPLGVINETHEPPTFNGIERPLFYQIIIPTTWSLEGAGFAGNVGTQIGYQLYVTNSIDGSKFSETKGIRSGRLHERPGNKQKAVSGRLTYVPLDSVKLGLSYFSGGVNSGNKGSSPEIDNGVNLRILETDVSASFASMVDLKIAYGQQDISSIEKLNAYFTASCSANPDCSAATNIAKQMSGSMAEIGFHVWPQSFKQGKLAESDMVVFYRFDNVDTQESVQDGTTANKLGKQKEQTVGLSFHPAPGMVVKLDQQTYTTEQDGMDKIEKFNFGVGFQF